MNSFYAFEHPSEYMSLGGVDIPMSLQLRAQAALKELEDIKQEFDLYISTHETAVKEREEKFEDAMSHFEDTKGDWARVEDEHGNISWVHTSAFVDNYVAPEWLAKLEAQEDVLDWGYL